VNGLRVVTRTALLFLLALALHGLLSERHVSTGSAPSRVIHVRYDAPADGIEQYRYVPIDVPPATDTLEVSCRYDDGGGETVVQLGLFEPGPLELGGSNFRGYGGNHREPIVIGQTQASLGYRAGPLPSGQWHLLVGLHKVPFDGVALDIEVTTRAGPLPNPGRWYAGGLHLHTVHSDGALTTADLLSRASRAGLDFVAITDHNNTAHAVQSMPTARLLTIVGEEVTTPSGHANVWGLEPGGWIDFRVRADEQDAADKLRRIVSAAHGSGALFSINHPFATCDGCAWRHPIPSDIDAVEIWNGATGPQESAVAFWNRLVESGRRVAAVGTSDFHSPQDDIDRASVRVYADRLSKEAILDGLRAGRVMVMRSAHDMPPLVTASIGAEQGMIGDSLRYRPGDALQIEVLRTRDLNEIWRAELFWNGRLVDSRQLADATVFQRPAEDGYAWIRLTTLSGETIALTNPFYVTRRARD